MISQIATVKSTFPGAFAALGVGAVAHFGIFPAFVLLLGEIPIASAEALGILGPQVVSALPYVLAFVLFFMTYASGFAMIGIGAKWRKGSHDQEAQRTARVFLLGDEALTKYYFEQRAVVDIYDGLGVSTMALALGLAAKPFLLSYSLNLTFLFCALGTTFLILGPWAMWRESKRRISDLDELAQIMAETKGQAS